MPAALANITTPDGVIGGVLKLSDFLLFEYHIDVLPHPAGDYIFSIYAKADAAMNADFSIFGTTYTKAVTTSWQRFVIHFSNDGTGDTILVRTSTSGNLYLYKAQLENATTVSDWRAAAEDNAAQISENYKALQAQADSIIANLSLTEAQANNISERLEETIRQVDANGDGIVTLRTDMEAKVTTTSDAIRNEFTTRIAVIENDVNETTAYVEASKVWQQFDSNGITLGKEDGQGFTANLSNTELSFRENGTRVAYINNNTMHITNAEITTGLQVGNFQFKPTETGMALVYIG